MKYISTYQSPIGTIFIVTNESKLLGITLHNEQIEGYVTNNDLQIIIKTKKWLYDYFSFNKPIIDSLDIELEGTGFQKEVWNYLFHIPYGKVITYGDIAKDIALKRGIKQMSSQAVGNALSKNPIPIIVPCHRVIGKNDKLVGFGLGLDVKEYLLNHERKKINE